MGKAARFACILTPMLLTLASLIIAIIVVGAGTNRKFDAWNKYYLVRIDTRGILDPSNSSLKDAVTDKAKDLVSDAASSAGIKVGFKSEKAKELELDDFYSTYLWNYCSGDVESDSKWKIKECKGSKFAYSFSIQNVVNDKSDKDPQYPDSVKKAQRGFDKGSKVMNFCYLVGIISTAATFVVGWFGLLSRWGSCVTLIFADAACAFLFIASLTGTILSATLTGAFNGTKDEFGVHAKLGKAYLSATWLAWLFSFGAAFFWLFSTCCCSGRTQRVMGDRKAGKAGKKGSMLPVVNTPYNYQRMASPSPYASQGNDSLPMHPYPSGGTSYEPMRHHGR